MTELRESLVSDKPPFTSLLLIVLVLVMGWGVVGPLIGFSAASLVYDGTLEQLKDQFESTQPEEKAFAAFMVMQASASFIGLILLPIVYIRFSQQKLLASFFGKESQLPMKALLICLLGLTTLVALSPVTQWNMDLHFPEWMGGFEGWARGLEDKGIVLTKFMTDFDSPVEFVFGLLIIAVIPAIGEEFVFRGLIQHELWRGSRNIHVAIWLSAILFSAFHFQFFGFFPRVFLGALFGYLYYWSGNLLIPMIAHFFNNAFSLTMLYLYNEGVSKVDIDDNTSIPVSLVAICVVITFGLLYFFKKYYSAPPDQPL
jgi:uncharacterized protein